MGKDIKIVDKKMNFVFRVSALVIHNKKVLLQFNEKTDYATLPGGKCKVGEAAHEAMLREIYEETKLECNFVRTRGIVENFFESDFDKKSRHEILFIGELSLKVDKYIFPEIIYNQDETASSEEYFKWIEINKLKDYNVVPDILYEIIKYNRLFHHVNREY